MTTTPVDELARALDATEPLIAAVRDEQLTAPTPCAEWNVRDLLTHLIGGNVIFARLARGEASSTQEAMPTDPLGDDRLAACRAATAELLAAFRLPGVLERTVPLPIGPIPGLAAVHLRIVEILTHGWDLARATGQTARYPDDLVELALTFTRERLGDVPSSRRPFAPSQPVPDDAPALDRLAALLGRSVDWRPAQ